MDSNQVAVENIAEALFSAKYQKPAYVTAIAQNDLNKQFAFEEKLSEERVLILREKLKSNSFSGSKDVTEILNQVEELEKADKYYEIIKKLIEPFIFNYETAKLKPRTDKSLNQINNKIKQKLSIAYAKHGENILSKQGALGKASLYFENASFIDENNWIAYHNQAVVQHMTINFKEALLLYQRAINIKRNEHSFTNLAKLYRQKSDYSKAIEMATEAIKINPDFISAYQNRGVAFGWSGNVNAAISDFEKVLSVEPGNKTAQRYLSELKNMDIH
jgi:tetratricopeptide (TPR) repeat protein